MAIIADLFSLIPGLNVVTNVIAAFAFYIAGLDSKVNLYAPERIPGTIVTIIIETFPVVSMFPTWTLRVFFAKRGVQGE